MSEAQQKLDRIKALLEKIESEIKICRQILKGEKRELQN